MPFLEAFADPTASLGGYGQPRFDLGLQLTNYNSSSMNLVARRRSDLALKRDPVSSAAGARRSTSTAAVSRTPTRKSDADRKSTRLNSSHSQISYAVFCLKKKI